MHNMYESRGRLHELRRHLEVLLEINLDVSIEELLSSERAFTYADLYDMLGNENAVVWLTPHAAVIPSCGRGIYPWMLLDGSCQICFNADGKIIHAFALSSEHFLEIVDVVLRLLAASVVHSVILNERTSRDGVLINAASLASLIEQCQSLKALTLLHLELDESHYRVIGAYSRPDLEIELKNCAITDAGASALAEVLGRNQGPTKLHNRSIDTFLIADGLRGNSRLKHLISQFSSNIEDRNRQVLEVADAIRENKGRVE
jgi:hypothetical protein